MMHPYRLLILLFLLISNYLFGVGPAKKGFIPNAGQWNNQVRYRMSLPNGAIFLKNTGFNYVFFDGEAVHEQHAHAHNHSTETAHEPLMINHHAIQMDFIGANQAVVPVNNSAPGNTKYSYFLGKEKSKWATGLHAYESVLYPEIYNGVDLNVYTNAAGIKYDFIVKANTNSDFNVIKMLYTGADEVTLQNEILTIKTSVGTITEQAPYAYQIIDGIKQTVNCSFTKDATGNIGFDLGNFNNNYDLIIDPQLIFATYSGSIDDNWGYTATNDNAGNGYSGGVVFGANFQTTPGAYQLPFGGGQIDIGILKYLPDGTDVIQITYLGGNEVEFPHSMIVNEYDELLLFGTTGSENFPTTNGAYETDFKGGTSTSFPGIPINNGLDIFVCRFSSDLSQLYASTYVGGTGNDGFNGAASLIQNYADEIRGSLWVDANNNVYVGTSTNSSDFPTTPGTIQPTYGGAQDGVILKLDGNLSTLIWSTYMGGNEDDGIYYLTVDADQQVLITGGTFSQNFPTTAGAWDLTYAGNGNSDGFVAKIDSNGQTLIASTFIGTAQYDQSYIVGTDKTEHVYVFGQTQETGNYFNTNTAVGVTGGNQFITKLAPDLSGVVWSTAFGNATGSPDISPTALLVDVCDKIYVTGWGGFLTGFGTTTNGLITTADAFQSNTDGNDFYLYVIDNQAQNLVYASFLGGTITADHVDGGTSRFDRKGVIYQSICASCGGQSDLPVTSGAYSSTNNASNCNNALVKFDFESPITVSAFVNVDDPVGCAPYEVEFNNTSVNADVFSWRIGDTEISNLQNFNYTFTESGTYEVTLIATASGTCNGADTVSLTVTVLSSIEANLPTITACGGNEVTLGTTDFSDPYFTYLWSPNIGIADITDRQPVIVADTTIEYRLVVSIGSCADTLIQIVNVLGGQNVQLPDLDVCTLDTIPTQINFPFPNGTTFQWTPNNGLSSNSIENPLIYTNDTIEYLLEATFPDGCIDSFKLKVNPRFDSFNAGTDKLACVNEGVLIGLPDSSGNYSYSWTPTSPLNNSTIAQPFATIQDTTQFIVTRIPLGNTLGCPAKDTIVINITNKPTALFGLELYPGCDGATVIFRDSSSDYQTLIWRFSNGIETTDVLPTYVFPYDSTLSAALTVFNGDCKDSLYKAVPLQPLAFYIGDNETNVFSPNTDGLNDCFSPALQDVDSPYNELFLPCTDILVFNRWGEKVFDSVIDNVPSCWDGKNRGGELLPEGVYYYIYYYDGKEKAGEVHLRLKN
jgi:gliding motility-associated-like protein